MKVILLEDVKGLGKAGEMVNSKVGYFRNFLSPKNLAIEANAENKKRWEEEQERKKEEFKKNQKEALALKEELEKLKVEIKVKAGDGKIFGSVTANDIAKTLKKDYKQDIDKKKIELKENIKDIGTHEVGIRVFPEIVANIKVVVKEA